MSAGVWVILGIIVVAIFIAKNSKGEEKNDVLDRFKEADALAPEIVKECVRAAQALPIVDEKTSWLLHDPVYDARTDQFDPPCKEKEFEWATGDCWLTPDSLPKAFEPYAEAEAQDRLKLSRPRHASFIVDNDHLDVVTCYESINEPGVYVRRVSRVGPERWHESFFRCGLKHGEMGLAAGNLKIMFGSDSEGVDPPIKAVDVAQDPTLWIKRTADLRRRGPSIGTWREAARLCGHKEKA